MNLRNLINRMKISIRINNTQRLLRQRVLDAEHYRGAVMLVEGQIIPALSLQLANLRLQQRVLREPSRPVLGQVQSKPQLKAVA